MTFTVHYYGPTDAEPNRVSGADPTLPNAPEVDAAWTEWQRRIPGLEGGNIRAITEDEEPAAPTPSAAPDISVTLSLNELSELVDARVAAAIEAYVSEQPDGAHARAA